MSSISGSDTSSIFRPVSYTSLRNLRHKLSNLFTPPHRNEAAERPLSTSFSLGILHSEPKRAGDQLNSGSASATRTTATTSARLLVHETLEPTQQLSQILFGKIPELPSAPPTKSTTHSGVKSDVAKRTPLQLAKIEAYEGPVVPLATAAANSCFDPSEQAGFKKFIRGEIEEETLYYGYRTTSFEHRSTKTELDAADCFLTNVINPILEVCQGWVCDGYKLIVSSQAYELPTGAIVRTLPFNPCLTTGGYIDHGIFLVRDDCESLGKGAEKVIVDCLPTGSMEWMAIVVIEEKVFGTVQPEFWNQTEWKKKLDNPIRPARTNKKQYRRTQLRLVDFHPTVKSILPQLRKYSDIFKCRNIMLSDYHRSVAISIDPLAAGKYRPALGIQVTDCSTAKLWDGRNNIEGIFEYGPRVSFAYLVWHALTDHSALRSARAQGKKFKRAS